MNASGLSDAVVDIEGLPRADAAAGEGRSTGLAVDTEASGAVEIHSSAITKPMVRDRRGGEGTKVGSSEKVISTANSRKRCWTRIVTGLTARWLSQPEQATRFRRRASASSGPSGNTDRRRSSML